MDPQQMKKIAVPVLAITAVLALVAMILLLTKPTGVDGQGLPPVQPGAQPPPSNSVSPESIGMSGTVPPLNAPEWKDIGEGLKIWDVTDGTGSEWARASDRVEMHYTGWLENGKVFDSSLRSGRPLASALSGLIIGWQKGIPGMKPGGIRRLYIPAGLAYGSRATGDIPPNSPLIFEVKLLKINP